VLDVLRVPAARPRTWHFRAEHVTGKARSGGHRGATILTPLQTLNLKKDAEDFERLSESPDTQNLNDCAMSTESEGRAGLSIIGTNVEGGRKRSKSFEGKYQDEFAAPSPTRRARVESDSGAERVVIGIVGGTGSGKTTVVNAIKERIEQIGKIAVLPHDSYYHDLGHLPLNERAQTNYDHPDSLDTDLLVTHLEKLKNGIPIECPTYDYVTATRNKQTVTVQATRLIIVEGILAFTNEKLRDVCDMKIFIDTEPGASIFFLPIMTNNLTNNLPSRCTVHPETAEGY
jgi:hypothetical protein